MYLAPVTPNSPRLLTHVARRPYHLALAHIASRSPAYAEHYHVLAEGAHVILDNGVAEGSRLEGKGLFDVALDVMPTELVLPDAVADCKTTHHDSVQFLRDFGAVLADSEVGFIYVIQACAATWVYDITWAMDHALHLAEEWPITAIAVSKFFSRDVGPRIKAVDLVLEELDKSRAQYRPEIHLLGLHDDIVELLLIERTWPGRVRGCDTSWPFVAWVQNKGVNAIREPMDVIDLEDPTVGQHCSLDRLNYLLYGMSSLAEGTLLGLSEALEMLP